MISLPWRLIVTAVLERGTWMGSFELRRQLSKKNLTKMWPVNISCDTHDQNLPLFCWRDCFDGVAASLVLLAGVF